MRLASLIYILKEGPNRQAGLATQWEPKSLVESLDDEDARNAEEEPLSLSSERVRCSFFLFVDSSLRAPLGPVNYLLVVGVKGEFVRQIFVKVAHPNSLLSASFIALTRLGINSIPDWPLGNLNFLVRFLLESIGCVVEFIQHLERMIEHRGCFLFLLPEYCSRQTLLTASSTHELFSSENR